MLVDHQREVAERPTDWTPRPARKVRRYSYAIASIILATAVRILLSRYFDYHHPYVTFYVAVLWSAWYGGFGPGLVATGLGALSAAVFIQPGGIFNGVPGESTLTGFEFYFIVTITAAILFEAQRRAELRSARNAQIATYRLEQFESEAAQRKLAEAAVLRAEAQFRVMVQHAPVGIARLTMDGFFTEVNPEFCAITGYSYEEALHLSFRDLTHPDDLARAVEGYSRLCSGKAASFSQLKRYIRKDQSIIWTDVTASIVRDPAGEPLYALVILQDATTRVRAEEQIREAQKLESIGMLAGGIAHDFNNLLTGILGGATLALQSAAPDTTLKKMLDMIVSSSERAAQLTAQLLAYAGKSRFLRSWNKLSVLTREAVELARAGAPAGVHFTTELKDDLPALFADPGQLQQLVTNLVLNAIEAIGEGEGEIRVRTGSMDVAPGDRGLRPTVGRIAPGEYLFVAVEDTGPGMDEATIRKIFDPFFTTKFTGRGLGLAAVSGIVRSQNGAILVASRPGEGATIEVLFPVFRNESPAKEPAMPPRGMSTRAK